MDTDSTQSDNENDNDNEGIEFMDSTETNLAMIGLGEVGYYIIVGAISCGATRQEAMDVATAFYIAARASGEEE